jgi:hypothetical protein
MMNKLALAAVAALALTGTAQAAGVNQTLTQFVAEHSDCTASFKMPCTASLQGTVLRFALKVAPAGEAGWSPIFARAYVPQFCQLFDDLHVFEAGVTKVVFDVQSQRNGEQVLLLPITPAACN